MDKQLVLALYAAFEAKKQDFIDAGVAPVEFIDRYRGQPQNPEQYEYYPLPAIFFSRKSKWTRNNKNYIADLQLEFHIVTEPTWETSNIATNKEEGLKYYTFLDQVREVLDNLRTDNISNMNRTDDYELDSAVTVYEIIGYECEFHNNTAVGKQYESHYPEDISLNGSLKTKRPITITDV